jgi:hypothetical protein
LRLWIGASTTTHESLAERIQREGLSIPVNDDAM